VRVSFRGIMQGQVLYGPNGVQLIICDKRNVGDVRAKPRGYDSCWNYDRSYLATSVQEQAPIRRISYLPTKSKSA